tara:strand:+ start:252 stop:572 length:321 start_codon:yes stop_codon:yes gene_type:complete
MCSYNDACETSGTCKKIQSLFVDQRFYIPIHNYFGTLTIEIVNKTYNKKALSINFWRPNKEYVLAKYDLRIADLQHKMAYRKDYDANGVIRLPISEFKDYPKDQMK